MCIQENLALICGIVEWCDFQKINRCGFVCDRIGVSGMLDSVPLAVNSSMKFFLMLYLEM